MSSKWDKNRPLTEIEIQKEIEKILNDENSEPEPFEDSGSDWEVDNLEVEEFSDTDINSDDNDIAISNVSNLVLGDAVESPHENINRNEVEDVNTNEIGDINSSEVENDNNNEAEDEDSDGDVPLSTFVKESKKHESIVMPNKLRLKGKTGIGGQQHYLQGQKEQLLGILFILYLAAKDKQKNV